MEVKRVVNYSKISHLIRITRLKDGLSKTYKSIREASRFMNETFNESVSHTELNRRVKLGIEYTRIPKTKLWFWALNMRK